LSLIARFRLALLGGCLFTTFFIASCAGPSSAKPLNTSQNGFWTGRISLRVLSEPEQFFSAGFELKGSAAEGELTLTSPLGNVLGVLRWSPSGAVLDSGNQQPRRFDSVDALMAQSTGAAVPLDALFAWLRGDGDSDNASGWTADLSRHGEGRIAANRLQPAPQVDLRVVLDR